MRNDVNKDDEADYGPEAIAIGKRIAQLRDAAGRENKDLADAMGVTINGIKKLISGDGAVGFAKLKKLAAALGVTPNEILGYPDHGAPDELWDGLEGTFEALGLPSDEAAELVLAFREAVEEPLSASVSQDRGTARRVLTASATRKFLKTKGFSTPRA